MVPEALACLGQPGPAARTLHQACSPDLHSISKPLLMVVPLFVSHLRNPSPSFSISFQAPRAINIKPFARMLSVLVVDTGISLFSWKTIKETSVNANRAQNFPYPSLSSIPFSSLLCCRKGPIFSWKGVNVVVAHFCHVHPQGPTMPPPPPGPFPAARSLRAGPQTSLPSTTAARCFLLQYVTGFCTNPPTLLTTCACPGA